MSQKQTPPPRSQTGVWERGGQPPVITSLSHVRTAFWRRRVVRWIIRALWLALLVPTITMVGYLGLDWQLSRSGWLSLMISVGCLSLLWSLRPINLREMSRRLDNLLHLQSQLITAYEVSHTPATYQEQNLVVDRLLQDTVEVTVDLRQQLKLVNRGFWLEMQALIAVSAILGALLVFNALTVNIPAAPPLNLPPAGQEPSADELTSQNPPPPQPPEPEPLNQEDLLSALQILADEFRDQAVTRSIAEDIDRADFGNAAAETRRLADQLEDLSKAAQQELGNNMQAAADKIGEGISDLTDPLEKGNQALDNDDLTEAGQALEELAQFLDSIDDDLPESPPQSSEPPPEEKQEQPGEVDEEGESQINLPPPEEDERLPNEGEDLELESESDLDEQVLQPSELEVNNNDETASDDPFSRQPLNPPSDELGPDPLIYPWEKRDIIRQYFTPSVSE